MDSETPHYEVQQCSKCPGDTAYYCVSCPCDLCPQCKENHFKNLKTMDHNVLTYSIKFNCIQTHEICVRRPSKFCNFHIEPCELTECYNCRGYRKERTLYLRTKLKRQRENIHIIRSKALFFRSILLKELKADFKTCHAKFSLYQSEMLTKAQALKYLIDLMQNDFMYNLFCEFDFKHRCLKQNVELNRHIVSLQRYVHIYEQRVIRPLQFLSSIKTALPKIHLSLHISQLSITESIKKDDVMELLSAIQLTAKGNQRNELMPCTELLHSLTVTGVDCCNHISIVTSGRFFVSDYKNNIILTNTTGDTLHSVENSCTSNILIGNVGGHTVNNENELFFIDRNYNIKKLSRDLKITAICTYTIRKSAWIPLCLYWSPSTEDLLVGSIRKNPSTLDIIHYLEKKAGKVTRIIQGKKQTQTVELETEMKLYECPLYIAENNNGDVVVSDKDKAVVVTERGGRHRFSYTGHPTGSEFRPRGICTDALSHILVCDIGTKTVQMLDIDGLFLTYLLIHQQGLGYPCSLSYDVNTHYLWVGSGTRSKVCVYRYVMKINTGTDQSHTKNSPGEIPTTGTEKPLQGNECLLKLMYPPKFHKSITMTGVDGCRYISCVTSDRVWVSNRDNIILKNTDGDTLHRIDNLCCGFYSGLHTVKRENELVYINRNFDIIKLSTDMKKTTTFVDRTDSTWWPRCVYWSPSIEEILVGMCYIHIQIEIGKVTRYNQNGQLTQTIQHNNRGRALYSRPNYITENNNGDVVVSDFIASAVVVTKRGGRYRFSYTGHPPGSGLEPRGICTDALSHILVCDDKTKAVHVLDIDGQFLSHLLTKSKEMGVPQSLSYDANTHRLWVGSYTSSTVCVYRYTKQEALKDCLVFDAQTRSPDGDASSISAPAVEWR